MLHRGSWQAPRKDERGLATCRYPVRSRMCHAVPVCASVVLVPWPSERLFAGVVFVSGIFDSVCVKRCCRLQRLEHILASSQHTRITY